MNSPGELSPRSQRISPFPSGEARVNGDKLGDVGQEIDSNRRKVAQEKPVRRRTLELARILPRGIKIGVRAGRPKPFFVRFGNPRKTESFSDERERNERASELIGLLEAKGRESIHFTPDEWDEFKKWRVSRKSIGSELVGPVVSEYLEKRSEEKISAQSLCHIKLHLTRFSAVFGNTPLKEITHAHLEQWLADLRKKKLGVTTIGHHWKDLSVFFERLVKQKRLAENPCSSLSVPRFEPKDTVAVMSVEDAFKFFKANAGHPDIWRFAAEAFGGVRSSSARRLVREDIDFAEQGIAMPALKHKTGRRHYVDGFQRNLWMWMARTPTETPLLGSNTYVDHKRGAFEAAGLKNPGNVFRHTFATMHLAAFKDTARLAVLLTHRNPIMLYQHYKGRGVPQRFALAYFKITPKTVTLTWERFAKLCGIHSTTNKT